MRERYRVEIPFRETISIPQYCAKCLDTNATESFLVPIPSVSWAYETREAIHAYLKGFNFPLCKSCHKRSFNPLGNLCNYFCVWFIVNIFLFIFVVFGIFGDLISQYPQYGLILIGLMGLPLGLSAFTLILEEILKSINRKKGFPPIGPVRETNGRIIFTFYNEQYAELFRAANQGKMIPPSS